MAETKQSVLQILNVGNEVFTKTGKGPDGGYSTIEIAYKDNGKVFGKKLVNFVDRDLYAKAKALKPNDTIVVSLAKEPGNDGREYWQWKSIESRNESAQPPAQAEGDSPSAVSDAGSPPVSTYRATAGKVTGSNYETADERSMRRAFDKIKHRQIGRQGCMNTAVEILKTSNDYITVSEVINVASQLEEYVFNASEESSKTNPGASGAQAASIDPNKSGNVSEAPAPEGQKRRGRPRKEQVVETGDFDRTDDIPF